MNLIGLLAIRFISSSQINKFLQTNKKVLIYSLLRCIMNMYSLVLLEDVMSRVSKHNYYLDIAETVAERCTCMRKKFGAIIVKDDVIVSTGYNGAPRGRQNCSDLNCCMRDKLNIPRGERYELCRSVHAEANAIIAASRERMLGATIYMACIDSKTGELVSGTNSCMMCKRLVINAGISQLIVRDTRDDYRVIDVQSWIDDDDSLSGIFGY